MDSAAYFDSTRPRVAASAAIAATRPDLVRRLVLVGGWPPPGIGRPLDLGGRVDIRRLLPLITAPTLVVGFAEYAMIPIDGSRQLSAGAWDRDPVCWWTSCHAEY
ncbi:hypothetical protein [Nonomuraea sp. B1E8]|uniref:alpha/beta fold hydrolase n=1 Tax=unclassified Nonomuraea TaxID=2593643 RepID=UPI00325F8153